MSINNSIHKIVIKVKQWRIFGKKYALSRTDITFDSVNYTMDLTSEIIN